jgi:hypothetical protein
MKVIYKYAVQVEGFMLELPREAEFLSVQVQRQEHAQSWWLLDPEQPTVKRMFRVRGTGHPFTVPDGYTEVFLGTFMLYNDDFVGHLFEVLR